MKRRYRLPHAAMAAAAIVAALALGGCATTSANAGATAGADAQSASARIDPLEGMNRAIFEFNEVLDDVLLRPLAKGYVAVVPELFRWMISNELSNLENLRVALNQLLQGKPLLAGSDLLRFGVNMLVGFGGISDPATEFGLERHREDFGQTLGRWGVANGPYLVLPLFGPSTLRDGLALAVVDWNTSPIIALRSDVVPGIFALAVVDTRASLLEADRLLEGAALDKYLFMRDGYLQRRRNQIWDGEPPEDEGQPR